MRHGYRTGYGATRQWLGYAPATEPPDTVAPAAPTGLSVTPGLLVNGLSWTDPADLDLAAIRVYRSETSGTGFALLDTVAPGVEEYEDEDVEGGVTYYYVLTAVDAASNESDPTGEESGTPEAQAAIMRSATGLVFVDTFEDGDVSDWTATGSLTRSALAGGRYGSYALRTSINSGSNGHWLYRDFTGHVGNFVVQVWTRQNSVKTSYIAFTDDRASAMAEVNLGMLALFRASPQQLQVASGASLANLGAYATNTWYKLTHVVNVSADTADSYLNNSLVQTGLALRGTIAGVNSMVTGFAGSDPTRLTDFDNIVICTTSIITASGLPAGYSLRAMGQNGATLQAAESSGTATLDVLTLDWPLTKVEVLDTNGDAVVAFDGPAYGGDAFAFTDGAAVTGDRNDAVFLTDKAAGRSISIIGHDAAYDATSGKTFFAYLGPTRDLYASSYDHATKAIATPVKIGDYPLSDDNDHGAPSMAIDAAGILHVVWGSHGTVHKYSQSDNARDISAWTTVNLTGNGTYPDLTIDPGTGDLYIIDRAGSNHPSHALGTLRVSTDDGDTWSAAATIVDTSGSPEDAEDFYPMGSAWAGGKLHFAWTVARGASHDGPHKNLYHAYFDPGDGHLYTAGGTDLGTSIDWTDHTACLVIDSGTDNASVGSITADANGIYLTANVGTLTDCAIVTAAWDGSSWEVVSTGIVQSHVYAQSFIRREDATLHLFAAERDTGQDRTSLNLYTSSDDGASWTFARTLLATMEEAGIERVVPVETGPFVALAQTELASYVAAAIAGSAPTGDGITPIFGILEPW